jgi:hypothetical protein
MLLVVGVQSHKHAVADSFAHGIARSFAFRTVDESLSFGVGVNVSADKPLPCAIESRFPIGCVYLGLCVGQVEDCLRIADCPYGAEGQDFEKMHIASIVQTASLVGYIVK